jgi:predicted metalloprotease
MRFRNSSRLDTSQVRDTRGRGGFGGFPRSGGVAIGGGAGILGVIVFILLQLLGGGGTTTSGALPGIDQVQGETGNLAQECRTGADANTKQDCRVVAVVNSLQDFWTAEFQRRGGDYQMAPTTLFSGGVQTGCGTASSDVGPFYCPRDATVYIDLSFYRDLQTRFGAQGGPFAQAYVLAHEYGHHVQNLTGTMERVGNSQSGAQSGAVRLELQADCYAGMWTRHATEVPDAGGEPYILELTDQDIAAALDAARAIGDDRIQRRTSGRVDPDRWTHGSAEQRMRWFSTGMRTGTLKACDTFAATRL